MFRSGGTLCFSLSLSAIPYCMSGPEEQVPAGAVGQDCEGSGLLPVEEVDGF